MLIAVSALYNQTWNGTYATNKGQYRGTDHYTIQSSYISSNATYPGQCPQAAIGTMLDLTGTTFSYSPWQPVQTKAEKNLATIHYEATYRDDYYTITRLTFPVIANQIYEISFQYFQERNANVGAHYYVGVGDDENDSSDQRLEWDQESVGSPPQRSGIDACWKDKVMPQTVLDSGSWNPGKLYFKPTTNLGYLRWDLLDYETSGLQWRNVYLTKLPADFCSS